MLRLILKHWLVGAILAIFLVGCGGSDGNGDGNNDTEPSATPTVSLACTPTDVEHNGNVTLEWSSTNADTCTASGTWSGEKDVNGTEEFGPLTADASFTLTCTGNDLQATETASVTVGVPPTPNTPTVTLNANPSSIQTGERTTLTWSSTNAESCTATGDWTGGKDLNSSEEVGPLTDDATFILTCSGNGAQDEKTVTVVVSDPPQGAPTVTLSVEPASVGPNETTTLTWSSTNAESCTASGSGGWSDGKDLSGSEDVGPFTDDATFTLTCSGNGSQAEQTVTVEYIPGTHTGKATLSWTAPTTNTDDTPLTDLAGYRIHMGTTSGNYTETIPVNDKDAVSWVVENLAPGTYFFAVSAVDDSGNESTLSNEASKEITAP